MRQQAIDRAMRELKLGAPPAVDRRTLYATLADELTNQLRQVHAGWCLNAAQAQWRQEGPVAVPAEADARAAAQAVGAFVDTGLAGLERAVLQLEIGAGRDTRTARAALRLGPREYARHREEGLSKLRSSIRAHARGRVCDDHRDAVVLAATGDADALQALSSGAGRCRSCAREATGLRRVLQERLAVAPWPLAIKPAGLVAAKIGFLGALAGGKGASGLTATAASSGLSTGGAIAIIATAAIATGTATIIQRDPEPVSQPIVPTYRVTMPPPSTVARATRATAHNRHRAKAQAKAQHRRHTTRRPPASGGSTAPASSTTTTVAAGGPTQTAATVPTGSGQPSKPSVKDTVDKTVDTVRQTTDPVTNALPQQVQQPVDQTLDTVQQTVDDVTGAVGGALPK